MLRFGRIEDVLAFEPSLGPMFLAPLWVGTHFPDADGPARSQPSLSGPKSWWSPWTQNLGKTSFCPGLQVMPILYSNSLFQRPTLGRTTLKNQDIRGSGNSMPGYIGRANLNSKEAGTATFTTALPIQAHKSSKWGVYPGRDETVTESPNER